MSAVATRELCCVLCGHPQAVPMPPSSAGFGATDLDMRPAHLRGERLVHRVQRCAACGHCARDLSRPLPGVDRTMLDDEHRQLLADTTLPATSRELLCCARLQAAAGLLEEPFWSTLEAAWVADDAGDDAAADRCRALALAALRMARAAGRTIGAQAGADDVLEADLLRRTGAFAEAARRLRSALSRPRGEVIEQVLRYQQDLVAEQDRAAHPVSEALR